MWEVSLNLDLQCYKAFKVAALCSSRLVEFATLQNLFPSHPDAAKKAELLIQSARAPRRLALAIMLIVTADTFSDAEDLGNARLQLPKSCEEMTDGERKLYASYIDCLRDTWVQEMQKG